MFISYSAYKFSFLTFPGVIFIGFLLLLVLLRPVIVALLNKEKTVREVPKERSSEAHLLGRLLWGCAAAAFAYVLYSSWNWPFAARLMPQIVATTGLLVILGRLVKWRIDMQPIPASADAVQKETRDHMQEEDPLGLLSNRELIKRSLFQVFWLLLLLVLVQTIGMLPAVAIYVPAFMIVEGRVGVLKSLIITTFLIIGMYLLFDKLLSMPWPDALIGDMYPEWRNYMGLRLF